jgi:hypothetical protein
MRTEMNLGDILKNNPKSKKIQEQKMKGVRNNIKI